MKECCSLICQWGGVRGNQKASGSNKVRRDEVSHCHRDSWVNGAELATLWRIETRVWANPHTEIGFTAVSCIYSSQIRPSCNSRGCFIISHWLTPLSACHVSSCELSVTWLNVVNDLVRSFAKFCVAFSKGPVQARAYFLSHYKLFFRPFCFPSRMLSELLMTRTAEEQINLRFFRTHQALRDCRPARFFFQATLYYVSVSIFSLFWRGRCTAPGLHWDSNCWLSLLLSKDVNNQPLKATTVKSRYHAKAIHNHQSNNNRMERGK